MAHSSNVVPRNPADRRWSQRGAVPARADGLTCGPAGDEQQSRGQLLGRPAVRVPEAGGRDPRIGLVRALDNTHSVGDVLALVLQRRARSHPVARHRLGNHRYSTRAAQHPLPQVLGLARREPGVETTDLPHN